MSKNLEKLLILNEHIVLLYKKQIYYQYTQIHIIGLRGHYSFT